MKVAACLFVRDEAHELTSWLAWYHLLGFDACIVYDDHSTDGTWELLCTVARLQDVRLHKSLGDTSLDHSHRQNSCYLDAIARYTGEFEWIGFFDADEYLRLYQSHTVQQFLSGFRQAGSIGINWCCYGSSGHALRPSVSPIEAYTWHSTEDLPINRHVKTFLRLSDWRGKYINMHCFDVAPDRSLDAAGTVIHWSETMGIIDGRPDWGVAKLMHYQCRSMEHFLERLRSRPRLNGGTKLWTAYDVNSVEDRSPLSFVPALNEQITRYNLAALPTSAVTERLREPAPPKPKRFQGLVMDIGVSEGNDTAYYLAKGFRVVAVDADPETCEAIRLRFRPEIEAGALVVLNFAASTNFGEYVEFFVHSEHQGISSLYKRRDVDQGGYSTCLVPTINWRTLLAQAGVPRYVKIDIEGHEEQFLSGILESDELPEFISIEAYKFRPCEMLSEMGFDRFKLVDQNPPGGLQLPARQLEGLRIESADFTHGSGPFGLDVFGDENWLDFAALRQAWLECEREMGHTWFDCHAWKPN